MEKKWFTGIVLIAIVISTTVGYYVGSMRPREVEEEFPPGSLKAILKAGKIRVITNAEYPPWEYLDEEGNIVGFSPELMGRVAEEMGVEVEWMDMGWDTALASIAAYKGDLMACALSTTEERAKVMDFTIPYHLERYLLFTWNGSGVVMNSLEDAAKYTIGILSGSIIWVHMSETLVETGLMPEENLILYPGTQEIVLDVVAKRLDLGIFMESTLPAFQEMYPELVPVWYVMDPNDLGWAWAIGKDRPELLYTLNQILWTLKRDGVMRQLKEKWDIIPGAPLLPFPRTS